MSNQIQSFLDKKNIIAVVGVSKDSTKYGNKIYHYLKSKGYNVYPINPNADTIYGDKCYKSLSDLELKPDVVNIVVPPNITEDILKECKKLNITKVWMQPGSESDAAIKLCEENNLDFIHDTCIMMH